MKETDHNYKYISWVTKRLFAIMDMLFLDKEGRLMGRIPTFNNGRSRTVAICPSDLCEEIIQQTHTQAHLGMSKTLSRIRLNWYWPQMASEVRRYVASCATCQQSKTTRTRTAGERQHLFAGRPWQVCTVDLLGPLQETESHNK